LVPSKSKAKSSFRASSGELCAAAGHAPLQAAEPTAAGWPLQLDRRSTAQIYPTPRSTDQVTVNQSQPCHFAKETLYFSNITKIPFHL
jgi:hypothetical protein